jgi:hypothetical protein
MPTTKNALTGPEHYRAAEAELAKASKADAACDYHLRRAQVHATLAAAAAANNVVLDPGWRALWT